MPKTQILEQRAKKLQAFHDLVMFTRRYGLRQDPKNPGLDGRTSAAEDILEAAFEFPSTEVQSVEQYAKFYNRIYQALIDLTREEDPIRPLFKLLLADPLEEESPIAEVRRCLMPWVTGLHYATDEGSPMSVAQEEALAKAVDATALDLDQIKEMLSVIRHLAITLRSSSISVPIEPCSRDEDGGMHAKGLIYEVQTDKSPPTYRISYLSPDFDGDVYLDRVDSTLSLIRCEMTGQVVGVRVMDRSCFSARLTHSSEGTEKFSERLSPKRSTPKSQSSDRPTAWSRGWVPGSSWEEDKGER